MLHRQYIQSDNFKTIFKNTLNIADNSDQQGNISSAYIAHYIKTSKYNQQDGLK